MIYSPKLSSLGCAVFLEGALVSARASPGACCRERGGGLCAVPRRFSETAALEAHSGEREKSGAGTAPSQLYRNLWEWATHFPGDCQVVWFGNQWVTALLLQARGVSWQQQQPPLGTFRYANSGGPLGRHRHPNLKLRGRDQPSVCSWTLQVRLALAHCRGLWVGFQRREGQTPLDLLPEKGGNRPLSRKS